MKLGLFALLLVALLVGVSIAVISRNEPPTDRAVSIPVTAPSVSSNSIASGPAHSLYFFDVVGHSAEEIAALLERAKDTYENLPTNSQDEMRIAMVLHGPDVEFFASTNYAKYRSLVDLAASLDAYGFMDLKVCTASASSRGLSSDAFPSFIELVPYGPQEISRLQSAGYVQL